MRAIPLTERARRTGRLLAAAALCVYLATASGSLNSIDAVMTYEVTKNLVTQGSVAASYDVFSFEPHRGVDGRFYSPFGIGQSVFNVPFYLAGHVLSTQLGLRLGRPDTLDKAAVALGNTVAAAGLVWVVFLFAWRLGGDLSGATRTALVAGFGTLVWPYSKLGFNAELTALCLTAGLYASWVGVRENRRSALGWGGVWLAGAFLTRHEMAVAVPLVAAWVAWESRQDWRLLARRATWLGLPVLCAVMFWLWYNALRFGNPFNTGNLEDPVLGFDSSVLAGVSGLLFSPGRSLFLYMPVALVGLIAVFAMARRDRSTAVLFAAFLIVFPILYGSLPYWDGSRGYGPRYLVPLVPLLVVPLTWWLTPGRGAWRRLVGGIAVLSAIVQVPGVLVDFAKVSVAYSRAGGGYDREARLYTWRESGITLNAIAAASLVPDNLRYVARGTRPAIATAPVADDDRDFAQRFDFSLDFWWLYLYYLGAIPAVVALTLAAGPLALAGVLFTYIGRPTRRS